MSQLKTDSVSQKTSVQLSVRGRPTAFDMCSSNDMAVVVSAGCMTFFHLNGLGAPCHVIHYEQNEHIEKVKFQKERHIAGLRGGVVSIWDPMHSLRPLLGFVKSTGSITSMEWSPDNPSLLATVCRAGEARVWDMRQRTSSLQLLSLNGSGKALGWNPSDPNVLATCSDNEVCLWDTRQSDTVLKRFRHEGVTHFTWTAQNDTIVLGTASGDSEWWDVSSSTKTHIISPHAVLPNSKLLSTPHGPGVVVTRPKASGGCGVSIMSSLQQSSLKSLYFQPGPDGALSGNQVEICTSSEAIVDMNWDAVGGLLSVGQASQSLVMLTESSVMHVVSLKPELLERYCGLTYSRSMPILPPLEYAPRHSVKKVKSTLISNSVQPHRASLAAAANMHPPIPPVRGARVRDLDHPADEFWAQIEDEVRLLEAAISKGYLKGLSLAMIDQYTRQVTLEMVRSTSQDALNFEEDANSARGISPESSRQLLEMDNSEKPPTLIIAFPDLRNPEFTVKSVYNDNADVHNNSLVAELLTIYDLSLAYENSRVKDADSSRQTSFLLDVARCFRNRVLQATGAKAAASDRTLVMAVEAIPTFADDHDVDASIATDQKNHSRIVIEPMAYFIPYPVTCGGIFNSHGSLLCFGGASLQLSPVTPPTNVYVETKEDINASIRNNSFAEMLHRIREEKARSAVREKMQSLHEITQGGITPATPSYLVQLLQHQMGESSDGQTDASHDDADDVAATRIRGHSFDDDEFGMMSPRIGGETRSPRATRRNRRLPSVSEEDWIDNRDDGHTARRPVEVISFKSQNVYIIRLVPFNGVQVKLYHVFGDRIRELARKYSLPIHNMSGKRNISFSNALDLEGGSDELPPLVRARTSSTHQDARQFGPQWDAIAATCRANSVAAMALDMVSMSHIWNLLACCLNMLHVISRAECAVDKLERCRLQVKTGIGKGWREHTLGQKLLKRVMKQLISEGNLQGICTVTCVLGGPEYVATLLDNDKRFSATRLNRLLGSYIDVLHMWNCHRQAVEISKYVMCSKTMARASDQFAVQSFVTICCFRCGEISDDGDCSNCMQCALVCSICQEAVQHMAAYCPDCGHGGHTTHLSLWFESNNECATGCGCLCSVFIPAAQEAAEKEEYDADQVFMKIKDTKKILREAEKIQSLRDIMEEDDDNV